ncbi:DUF6191 domain-containing protein [Streptomyces erythrochromogenes]|uniref:DUF6191 domain-containing protein n=1 Tax=Streptomyces erythrochromogenes TaxID=285574 RepID=UPI0036777F7C
MDTVFNMIEELFNPGRKHTNDEKKRLELSRTDVGDNDPGRGPIDLDSGKVLIRVDEEPAADRRPARERADRPDRAG